MEVVDPRTGKRLPMPVDFMATVLNFFQPARNRKHPQGKPARHGLDRSGSRTHRVAPPLAVFYQCFVTGMS
jgi:hypothetical protein